MLHDRKGNEIKRGDIVTAKEHTGTIVDTVDGVPSPNVVLATVNVKTFRSGVAQGAMVECSDGLNRLVEPSIVRVGNHECEIVRTVDGRSLD